MTTVSIVTDSTSYLNRDLISNYGIKVVPLSFHFPDQAFKDGEIGTKELFAEIDKRDTLPTTSPPDPQAFVDVFTKLRESGREIVTILISAGISKTYEHALSAAKTVDETSISVIDSRLTSAGLALLVEAAAKAAAAGASRDQIVEQIEEMKKHIRILFVPQDLKYLKMGGRIGGAKALMGNLLQIKPVLCQLDGTIEEFYRVRTMEKAIDYMAGEVMEGRGLQIRIMQADAEEGARKLLERVKKRFPDLEVQIMEISPVIGIHTGPGTVGICFYQEDLFF